LFSRESDGRISGYIRDSETGEPLMYTNTVLVGQGIGSASNTYGYFVISGVPADDYTLRVSYVGYKTEDCDVSMPLGGDIRIDIELDRESIQGEDIIVTAERIRFMEKVEISRTNISFREVKAAPAFIESDLFRSIQMLPGVTSQNDFSSALIVRGGSPDENLILLDGAEIYNPYHIGGVFSTFNADAIADAEFLAGGYPVEYGGRISSVLNITSKEGNSKSGKLTNGTPLAKYWDLSGVKGEISALSSKVLLEGPLYRGSWMISLRRTYFDQLAKLYYWIKKSDQSWKYYFWDSQIKLVSDINKKNRLSFSTFTGRDRLAFIIDRDLSGEINFDWDWGNSTSNLQWRYVPNSRYFSEMSLSKTVYSFDVDLSFSSVDSVAGKASNRILVKNSVEDICLREKVYCYLNSYHTLTFGIELKRLGISFKQMLDDIKFFDISQSPMILSFFVRDQWKPSALLTLQFGIRITKYEIHKHLYTEPRLGIKYNLTENTVLKGSWGKYYQFLFTTNDENQILRIVDFWEPIPKYLKAASNQHIILGVERWLGEGFTGSIESYYKPYSYLLGNNPNNNPAIDTDDFITGTGKARGIELLIRKLNGKLTGWLGYSYNYVQKRIDFNGDGKVVASDDEVYYPNYYRPHIFNLFLNYKINKRNRISLTLTTSSGQLYTPVLGKVYTQSNFGDIDNPYQNLVNIYGRRNSETYPKYIRGDIGWMRNISPFGITGKFKIQVINFTNHFNVLIYNWDHSKSPSRVSAIGMFPIIPTIGVEFEL